MRRAVIILFAVSMVFSAQAQQKKHHGGVKQTKNLFMDFGIKGMYGSSLFVNSNLFSDNNYNYAFSGSYGVGGKVAIDFGEHVALVVEGIYSSTGQKFNISDSLNGDWTKSIRMNTMNIPILIRKNNPETGSYAEFGPMISLMSGFKENGITGSATNTKGAYNQNFWSMVFGFGGYLWGTDNFGISSGLRFVYTFQDIAQDNSSDIYITDRFNDAMHQYSSYQKTTPLSAFFVLEVNYDLGFILAKNECTGRRKFLFYN